MNNWLYQKGSGVWMSYWIMVFTKIHLGRFSEDEVLSAITTSNFNTLCDQYGLDPALIQPTVDCLAVELAAKSLQPLFALRYQPKHQPPIVVTEWAVREPVGAQLMADVMARFPPPIDHENLEQIRFVYSVELVDSQLSDLGLLLGYELARWIADRGAGLVLGLDRTWYRLNAFQAFIPFS